MTGPALAALAMLLSPTPVRAAPDLTAPLISVVPALRPITGVRTVLPAVGHRKDSGGHTWLHVRLPGRTLTGTPPPATGWIRAAGTVASTTPWQLRVSLRTRTVRLFRLGQAVRTFRVVVGRAGTPTPRGDFFVEENVRLPQGRVGAPFALALSARSPVFQEFDGGPGQIAIHGRRKLGGRLGTAVSHGCIRMADADITWLAARIGPGVLVTVH